MLGHPGREQSPAMYRYRQSRFLSRSKKFRVSSLHNLFIHDNYRREGEKIKESVVVVVGIRLVSQHEPKSIIIFSSFLPESGSLWQSPGGVQYTVYYLVCGLVAKKKKKKKTWLNIHNRLIDGWPTRFRFRVSKIIHNNNNFWNDELGIWRSVLRSDMVK